VYKTKANGKLAETFGEIAEFPAMSGKHFYTGGQGELQSLYMHRECTVYKNLSTC
jgi:hypothetical protein